MPRTSRKAEKSLYIIEVLLASVSIVVLAVKAFTACGLVAASWKCLDVILPLAIKEIATVPKEFQGPALQRAIFSMHRNWGLVCVMVVFDSFEERDACVNNPYMPWWGCFCTNFVRSSRIASKFFLAVLQMHVNLEANQLQKFVGNCIVQTVLSGWYLWGGWIFLLLCRSCGDAWERTRAARAFSLKCCVMSDLFAFILLLLHVVNFMREIQEHLFSALCGVEPEFFDIGKLRFNEPTVAACGLVLFNVVCLVRLVVTSISDLIETACAKDENTRENNISDDSNIIGKSTDVAFPHLPSTPFERFQISTLEKQGPQTPTTQGFDFGKSGPTDTNNQSSSEPSSHGGDDSRKRGYTMPEDQQWVEALLASSGFLSLGEALDPEKQTSIRTLIGEAVQKAREPEHEGSYGQFASDMDGVELYDGIPEGAGKLYVRFRVRAPRGSEELRKCRIAAEKLLRWHRRVTRSKLTVEMVKQPDGLWYDKDGSYDPENFDQQDSLSI